MHQLNLTGPLSMAMMNLQSHDLIHNSMSPHQHTVKWTRRQLASSSPILMGNHDSNHFTYIFILWTCIFPWLTGILFLWFILTYSWHIGISMDMTIIYFVPYFFDNYILFLLTSKLTTVLLLFYYY